MKSWSKKLISTLLVLAFVMCAGIIVMAETASEPEIIGGGYTDYGPEWSLDSEGTLVIWGEGPIRARDGKPNNFPWFAYRNDIKNVVIEYGITQIGRYAFTPCGEIESISIPCSVTQIESQSIKGTKMTHLSIPHSVKNIGANAISCSAETLEIYGQDTFIDERAFNCPNLKTVKLPKNLQINSEAFRGCENISEIQFSGTEEDWKEMTPTETFSYHFWYGNVTYNCPPLLYVEDIKVISPPDEIIFECEEDVDLTGIELSVKWSDGTVETVTDPSKIAVCDGKKLEPVTAKYSGYYLKLPIVLKCYEDLFPSGKLGSVEWVYDIKQGILIIAGTGATHTEKDYIPWSEYADYAKKIIVKNGIEVIGPSAFSKFVNTTEICLPESVTVIKSQAFENCDNLESIKLPENLEIIPSLCFFGCDKLNTITFPKNVKTIEASAFRDCYGLENLELPDSIYNIEEQAFLNCYNLVYVKLPENLEIIPNHCFFGCNKLNTITFPKNVKTIEKFAFRDCYGLENLDLPDSIVDIKKSVFENCTNLKSVKLPKNLNTISYGSFYGCDNLKTVSFSSNVKTIYNDAFESTSLESVYFNGTATDWSKIDIKKNNSCLLDANLYFNGELHTHSYTPTIEKEAECDFPGVLKYVCECGKNYSEQIPGLNHIAGEWKEEPSGFMVKRCTLCNTALERRPLKKGSDVSTKITYSYEEGCFDYNGKVDFEVAPKTKSEYGDSFKGYVDDSEDIFFFEIKFYAVDENDNRANELQPSAGKKVKIGFPIPEKYKGREKDAFWIIHKRTDNGRFDYFMTPYSNIDVENGYVYIWTDNFSPFALVINYTENAKNISSVSIATLPTKTSYTYKIDTLDLSGLELTVTYSDGTTETVTDTSKMNVTGFDNTIIDEQIVSVEYEGFMAKFTVKTNYAWWQWIIRILLLGFLWY